MRYMSLLIGVAIFSVIAGFMFYSMGATGNTYSSTNANTYTTLGGMGGTYDFTGEVDAPNSTVRRISSLLQGSQFDIVSAGFAASIGALNGVKSIFDSVGTVERISNQIQTDTSGLGIYPGVWRLPSIIIGIVLAMVILAMIWRYNASTD